MRHLNYSHLRYFHTVAREGSIARAAEILHLTPQTISGQIKTLEKDIGAPLFEPQGRGLALSETGHVVKQYADEIFALGAELSQWVSGLGKDLPGPVNIGIVNSIPKLVAHAVLNPALELDPAVKLVCREDNLNSLLAELAVHRLDLVLSDQPIPSGLHVRAFNHHLGESPVCFFAQQQLASRFSENFPESLHDAPLLMPYSGSPLRRDLDSWFDEIGVTPRIVAEFDDSALLKAFGEAGGGLFPAPRMIERALLRTYRAHLVGSPTPIRESYYALSPERVLRHAAVRYITEAARGRLSMLERDRA